jgi:hypothetical protein
MSLDGIDGFRAPPIGDYSQIVSGIEQASALMPVSVRGEKRCAATPRLRPITRLPRTQPSALIGIGVLEVLQLRYKPSAPGWTGG